MKGSLQKGNKIDKKSLTSSMTFGSRSTNTALGTCFPEDVSEKNALKESSAIPIESSSGNVPSG